jgi:hypothetical protein
MKLFKWYRIRGTERSGNFFVPYLKRSFTDYKGFEWEPKMRFTHKRGAWLPLHADVHYLKLAEDKPTRKQLHQLIASVFTGWELQ